jgi:hypothetical protein
MPDFTVWENLFIDIALASSPFVGPGNVPAPFSILLEFASGVMTQGFFDANGVASTQALGTLFSFDGQPTYGYTSSLRPDADPKVQISFADEGLPFPVPTPPTVTLLMVGIGALALMRRHAAMPQLSLRRAAGRLRAGLGGRSWRRQRRLASGISASA